jgi:hypothetical protein
MSCDLRSLTAADLVKFEGKGPEDWCTTGLITQDQNHCAHFVCHAIGLKAGRPLCGDMQYKSRNTGVTIRVNDVFNYCTTEGFLDAGDSVPAIMAGISAFFVVATISGNLEDAGGAIIMHDNPRKHIGIYINGKVWNFSNRRHYVVCDTLDEFTTKMRKAYGSTTRFLYAYRQDI